MLGVAAENQESRYWTKYPFKVYVSHPKKVNNLYIRVANSRRCAELIETAELEENWKEDLGRAIF